MYFCFVFGEDKGLRGIVLLWRWS